MSAWLYGALANGSVLKWTYKFDWTGDGAVDQTFTITVDPSNITLNKDGSVWCKTENGMMVVKDGEAVSVTGTIEKITEVGTVNGDSIIPAVERANAAGIPVIATNRGLIC